MTTIYTNDQLKRTLAKMSGLFDYTKELGRKTKRFHWNRSYIPVLDTELLHLCWLVEESLSAGELCDYGCELVRISNAYHDYDHDAHWGKLAHATWQQRVVALAKVKNMEIV